MTDQAAARQSNDVVIAILELEQCGYIFLIVGDVIRYLLERDDPDPDYVRPRLAMIKENHQQAIEFLIKRAEPFDLASRLLNAAQKTIDSARRAEKKGDLKLSRREWGRLNRLAGALADAMGEEPTSGQSWEDWIKSIKDRSTVEVNNQILMSLPLEGGL